MKSINKLQFHAIVGIACTVLFVLLMMLVILADVQPIGPEESRIGLATLNGSVRDALGYRPVVYLLSELLGLIALLTPVLFALIGFKQLMAHRSFFKVDSELYALALVYVMMALCYIFFELCVFNYRPILMDGELEASFPSSHTMLAITLLGTAAPQFRTRFGNIKLELGSYALMAAIVVTRLVSGVHWLTDIIGGLLLGTALVQLYHVVITLIRRPDFSLSADADEMRELRASLTKAKPAHTMPKNEPAPQSEEAPPKKKTLPKLFNRYEPKH